MLHSGNKSEFKKNHFESSDSIETPSLGMGLDYGLLEAIALSNDWRPTRSTCV
jgi:hypothetical protein